MYGQFDLIAGTAVARNLITIASINDESLFATYVDVTIAIAGRYTIPKTYNGRKVRSGTLIAYGERSVKSYQVERHNDGGSVTISV